MFKYFEHPIGQTKEIVKELSDFSTCNEPFGGGQLWKYIHKQNTLDPNDPIRQMNKDDYLLALSLDTQ